MYCLAVSCRLGSSSLSHGTGLSMQVSFLVNMNQMPFSSGTPPPWFMVVQPDPVSSSSFWETTNVHAHLQSLQDTIDLAKSMRKELEVLLLSKETYGSSDKADATIEEDAFVQWFSKVFKEKRISLEMQESNSLEVVNSLITTLKSQTEPFNVLTSQASSWEEKSAAARLADKIQKNKRNKRWRKRKRKHYAEMLVKERERFDIADQEADEWRAREIAKDIARRKAQLVIYFILKYAMEILLLNPASSQHTTLVGQPVQYRPFFL